MTKYIVEFSKKSQPGFITHYRLARAIYVRIQEQTDEGLVTLPSERVRELLFRPPADLHKVVEAAWAEYKRSNSSPSQFSPAQHGGSSR